MRSLPEENEIDLNPSHLSTRKNIVRVFYKDIWDQQKVELIPKVFHQNFTFRGSLGPVLIGHEQFKQYVLWLTEALEDYTSDILDLIEEGDQVSGKLRFHGIHRDLFFGHPPTQERVWWHGAPIFTFEGDKIRDLWVLGDIYGLVKRLETSESAVEFSVR
ncbi:ester cyclase [Alloalcanivorax sp. C16-2]|uniref:ester cyclase n=1 Tax=Alloalcanivorax TaxID=3020832 RepID=UPI0019322A62|nr:ester cyclase [Alloalcanivorax marinus]MBL7250181.1 ester cyclase [Alloalcanivorax marinus]